MEDRRGVRRVWSGNMRERDYLEETGVDGKMKLKWIFRKWDVRSWIGLMGLRTGTGGGHL